MKLRDSIAAQCRYGEEALRAFGEGSELIWECSEDDYQGNANILVRIKDIDREIFIHYEWTYGSCSGCDEWESRALTGFEIVQEMLRDCNQFNSREELEEYLNLTTGNEQLPRSTDFDNGSIPGMSRVLFGGIVNGFDLESVDGVCNLVQNYEKDKDTESVKLLWWKKLKRDKEKF